MFEIFIRRPVLATVVSLMIFLLGLKSLSELAVREYPEMTNTVITITTTYPGASAELMQGFVTQPIQSAIATASGIDYVTSQSSIGKSEIKVYVKLDEDPDRAMTEVMAKVSETRSVLPSGIDDPVIVKATGQQYAPLYLALYSEAMSPQQITDYVVRVIEPKLTTVRNVAQAQILGAQKFAMRIWLNPEKLAEFNVSAAEVGAALQTNSVQSAAGGTKGWYDIVGTSADTDLKTVEDFRKLSLRSTEAGLIRLRDVATVELGAESVDASTYLNGKETVVVGVKGTPEANPIEMVREVRAMLPALEHDFPAGMRLEVAYDATLFINDSIREVMKTIVEASITVMIVIYLFMGSLRSVVIPLVTVPLSLVGVCGLLLALGFSINLLTLLAMVLAIGLVVDDAIVVVENIHRHIELGETPFEAALAGTREIASPVISMTITLAAVYAPIAFMGGLTGSLFREFALTLAGSVVISGIVALTLSPMMSSKALRPVGQGRGFSGWVERGFHRVQRAYQRALTALLRDRAPTVVFALITCGVIYGLWLNVAHELAPEEDQGWLMLFYQGPTHANTDYLNQASKQVITALRPIPEIASRFALNGIPLSNQGFGFLELGPRSERTRSQKAIQPDVQAALDSVPALVGSAFALPSLPTSDDGMPIQFVITTIAAYRALDQVVQDLKQEASRSGLFAFMDVDLKVQNPQNLVQVDRDKAATFGVSMKAIGDTLAMLTGGNYVNRINLFGRSYEVIPQVPRGYRLTPDSLGAFYVKTQHGTSIPLSSLVTLSNDVQPVALTQFNQLNSATLQAVPMPGVALGTALAHLSDLARQKLPVGFTVDYAGQSRQYLSEGSALTYTFVFALLVIYLVLAAQFESLRDPLIIMISVPLSICGALIPLALGVSSLNIYSQVGLVTLVGLITKHGILIVEVARTQQIDQGLDRAQAVIHAATLRLRPILMTTAAMVAGSVPLLIAHGAGAESRRSIAVVIVAGMSIGTLFTLFVLPVIYTFLARERRHQAGDDPPEQARAQHLVPDTA